MDSPIYGWAAGLTLWMMAGFILAIIYGRITQARDTQIPHDTTGDIMPTYNYGDPSYDYPETVINNRSGVEYNALRDPMGDLLPIVDAFCQGYAEAILWANAYHYVSEDDCLDVDGEHELEIDTDAQYAYQSPGKWWEGIGIDFTDAIDFLASNLPALDLILLDEAGKRESAYVAPNLIRWNVYAQHGHDFALTRNGHGAGFWGRGYGDVGDRLTEAAEAYGEHSVLTDDGPAVTTL